MRTLKLTVTYDGSCYHGFQKQPGIVTVQGILEEMLEKLCGEKVSIAGSGRTDAGVHALAQTITFTTNGRIPCPNIIRAARSLLPKDIVVLSAENAMNIKLLKHRKQKKQNLLWNRLNRKSPLMTSVKSTCV